MRELPWLRSALRCSTVASELETSSSIRAARSSHALDSSMDA